MEGTVGGSRDNPPFDYVGLRKTFSGVYIANNGYTREEAVEALDAHRADLIAFGVPFLANPDLVERLRRNAPLNTPDKASFYGGDAHGYTDYPALGVNRTEMRRVDSAAQIRNTDRMTSAPTSSSTERAGFALDVPHCFPCYRGRGASRIDDRKSADRAGSWQWRWNTGPFAIAGIILLCFAVGYAAMSRRIVATGAFYTYITEGLGTTLGVSSAYTALVAYLAFTFGLAAFFGYFTSLVLGQAGLHLPWLVYAVIGIFIVGILGYRSIDLSSAILGVLMIGEVIILAIFDIAVIHAKGFSLALPANAWNPHAVFTPGLGVSLMVAFTCFVGFESAALYGEESARSKTPRSRLRPIPR